MESGLWQQCLRQLPTNGLPDNKQLLRLIKKIKLPEKPLHENAKTLKVLVKQVETQAEKLRSFDGEEFIKAYCENIELEASEAIQRAIKHLEEIEREIMKQTNEFRNRCLQNISEQSSDIIKQESATLTQEISNFIARWNNYFTRIDVYENESEIEAALAQAAKHVSIMQEIEEKLRKEALNWEKMMFKVNSQFLNEWKHVGEIEISAEPKPKLLKQAIVENNSETEFASIEPDDLDYSSHEADSLAEKNSEPIERQDSLGQPYMNPMPTAKDTRIQRRSHTLWVCQVMFLLDGRLASCSDDDTIKIWNIESGKELFELRGHTATVFSIVILSNGNMASGSLDKTIKIWDLEKRKEIRTIKAHSDSIFSLRVLKNGNLASYSKDDTIKIWSLKPKEKLVSTLKGHGNTSLWLILFGVLSNDYLVTCSRHKNKKENCILRVWNPSEANPIKSISISFNDALSLLVLSNDQVALGFDSGTIKIIDLNDEALTRIKEKAHDIWVYSLAQLSNANLISAGKDDSNETIKVWSSRDWSLYQVINTGHSLPIISLSISADESILASASHDKTIKLWPIGIK